MLINMQNIARWLALAIGFGWIGSGWYVSTLALENTKFPWFTGYAVMIVWGISCFITGVIVTKYKINITLG